VGGISFGRTDALEPYLKSRYIFICPSKKHARSDWTHQISDARAHRKQRRHFRREINALA
jgi:hypothetical protein